MENDLINPKEALRVDLLSSLEDYTKAMFLEQYKKPFITSNHHRQMFDVLEKVVDGEITKLIINIAPRYSKTEIVVKSFISWCFAINPMSKFIHLSYSDSLVQDNSRAIQGIMSEPLYTSLFPNAVLPSKRTNGTRWNTIAGGGLYAVSTQGQVTGFGAGDVEQETDYPDEAPIFSGAIVIDDPIKPEDALSDVVRERVNQRFENTIRNRVNSRHTPIIIIMQRLHEHDLCGYLQSIEEDDWTVLSLPCITTDTKGKEKALWEHKHTLKELYKIKQANSFVFETQYMQNPTPLEGLLYQYGFQTYETLPNFFKQTKKCLIDTADTGSDYFVAICYIEGVDRNIDPTTGRYKDTLTGIYVTDVFMSQKGTEFTEPESARMITRNGIEQCLIEQNNGGRSIRKEIERQCRTLGNTKTRFTDYFQSQNKETRLFTYAADVQNMVKFPKGWETRWAEFASQLLGMRREGRNAFDDVSDAITKLTEFALSGNNTIFAKLITGTYDE